MGNPAKDETAAVWEEIGGLEPLPPSRTREPSPDVQASASQLANALANQQKPGVDAQKLNDLLNRYNAQEQELKKQRLLNELDRYRYGSVGGGLPSFGFSEIKLPKGIKVPDEPKPKKPERARGPGKDLEECLNKLAERMKLSNSFKTQGSAKLEHPVADWNEFTALMFIFIRELCISEGPEKAAHLDWFCRQINEFYIEPLVRDFNQDEEYASRQAFKAVVELKKKHAPK